MRLIPLSRGMFAQVDDEDFDYLNQWKWYAKIQGQTVYAKRASLNKETGKHSYIAMHRVIMKLTDVNIYCDHIDHNGLNNQKSNLREATLMQNRWNRSSMKNKTSKYLGVSKGKRKHDQWQTNITINGKGNYIGSFKTEDQAAIAYNIVAMKHRGKFANLNQIFQ